LNERETNRSHATLGYRETIRAIPGAAG
jgi:hypothetical protein